MGNKKFLYILGIFLIIGMTSFTINAKATNPEHLDLEYDDATQTFSIYVYHGVTDPDVHYINYLEVQKGTLNDTDSHHLSLINGTIVASESFTSQDDFNINHHTYVFAATRGDDKLTGDALQVTVTCNFGGVYTEFEYLFPRPAGHEFAFVTVVPAFIIGSLISLIFATLPLLIKKNRKDQLVKFKRRRSKS
ncbi:MAG: hypothetical protein ACXABO_04330 [Promethearchaeota archaeon]